MKQNKVIKQTDNILKFIQQSFNIDKQKIDFSKIPNIDINKSLKNEIEMLSLEAEQIAQTVSQRKEAEKLKNELHMLNLTTKQTIYDTKMFSKFSKLGGIPSYNITESYKVIDELINDITNTREWNKHYKKLVSDLNTYRKKIYNKQEQLKVDKQEMIALGLSILGRAIELCPKDTGYLRSTGTLYELEDSIIIAFTAPYAIYVHENLEVSHPVHKNNPNCGGEAKFLEKAVQEFFPDRTTWVETLGEDNLFIQIGFNPEYIKYNHYD